MPFFSLLDPRAKPAGSRDPLGFELIWTRFGRQIIGSLTTITGSIENFAVALLGFELATQLATNASREDRHAVTRDTFLRYEQLAGYLRFAYASNSTNAEQADPNAVMGITRVRAAFSAGDAERADIDIGPAYPILSDQASYGLWGLYSGALRMTRLVEGDDRIPSSEGKTIAQKMLDAMQPDTRSFLLECMQGAGRSRIAKKEFFKHAASFHEAITEPTSWQMLFMTLLRGGVDQAASPEQEQLFKLTKKLFTESGPLPSGVGEFVERALELEPHSSPLAVALSAINQIERVLVTINRLFDFLRTQDGQLVAVVSELVSGKLDDTSYLPEHIPLIPNEGNGDTFANHDRLESINAHLLGKDFEAAIREIVGLNDVIMQQRSGAGGSGWVYIEADRIRVRRPRENFGIDNITLDALKKDWDYNYFLESFLRISERNRHLFKAVA